MRARAWWRQRPAAGPAIGGTLLAGVVGAVAIGPLLATGDPDAQDLAIKLRSPSTAHWLGTDQYGRDLLLRILHGGRLSLTAAVVITATSVFLGLVVGLVATLPRPVGPTVTAIVDTLVALPSLVMALAVVGALGIGMRNLVIAFVIVGWPFYARLIRGFALERMNRPDIDAGWAMGFGRARLLGRHVAPATMRSVAVAATLDLGYTLAALAGFSYLGLGAQAPTAEWGLMLRDAQMFFTRAPWLLLGPSAAIALTVLGTTMLVEHAHGRQRSR